MQAAVIAGVIVLYGDERHRRRAGGFRDDSYTYCMGNAASCVVAADVAATTAAGVPGSTVNYQPRGVRGNPTSYYAGFAANGAARITPGAQVVQHPNGT